jgi:signal transduction histidine kinase
MLTIASGTARRVWEASLHRVVYTLLFALVALALATTAVPLLRQYSGAHEQVIGTAVVLVLVIELAGSRLHRFVDWLLYGQRDDPTAVTARLSRALEDVDDDHALESLVAALADTLRLTYVTAVLDTGGTEPARVTLGVPSSGVATFPVRHAGTPLGELRVARRGQHLDHRDQRLLRAAGAQIGLVLHAARLAGELRTAREDLLLSVQEERRRLRRDIHDGVGPTLAGIALGVESAERAVARDPARATALLSDVRTDVSALVDDVRRVVDGLRPPLLDEIGLVGAFEQLARSFDTRGSCRVQLSAGPLPALPAAVEVAAWHIGAEAVTNAARHAAARHTEVSLSVTDDVLVLRVCDDGHGGAGARPGGTGLASMRDRADEVGGTIEVASDPSGTSVTTRLPIHREPHRD